MDVLIPGSIGVDDLHRVSLPDDDGFIPDSRRHLKTSPFFLPELRQASAPEAPPRLW